MYPPARRGVANGGLAAALAAGPALGTFAGGLILATEGWRTLFFVFGAATLLWLIPWRLASRDLGVSSAARTGSEVSMRLLLRQALVWKLGAGLFCATYSFFFLLAWLPLYLVKERGFTLIEMTGLTTAAYLVQAVSALWLGWLSDRLILRGWDEGKVRKGLLALSLLGTAAAIVGTANAGSTAAIGAWLILAGASMGPAATNSYAIAQIFGGPRAAGSWSGAMNGIGNLSGVVGPLMTGAIVDRGSYSAAFLVAAAISTIGALWWWFALPRIEQVVEAT